MNYWRQAVPCQQWTKVDVIKKHPIMNKGDIKGEYQLNCCLKVHNSLKRSFTRICYQLIYVLGVCVFCQIKHLHRLQREPKRPKWLYHRWTARDRRNRPKFRKLNWRTTHKSKLKIIYSYVILCTSKVGHHSVYIVMYAIITAAIVNESGGLSLPPPNAFVISIFVPFFAGWVKAHSLWGLGRRILPPWRFSPPPHF